jgi:outer membrane protein
MSESDRRAKEQELARVSLDFQRMQPSTGRTSTCGATRSFRRFSSAPNRVIRQIAEAEKFDLIIQEAVVPQPAHGYHGSGAQGACREQIAETAGAR